MQLFEFDGQVNGVQGNSSVPDPDTHNFQFDQGNPNAPQIEPELTLVARNSDPNMLQTAAQLSGLTGRLSLMSLQQPNQPPNTANLGTAPRQLHPGIGEQPGPNVGQNGFFDLRER